MPVWRAGPPWSPHLSRVDRPFGERADAVEFERIEAQPVHLPVPVALFAKEHRTGTEIAMRREQLLSTTRLPFDDGADVQGPQAARAEEVAREQPAAYLKILALLVPREMKLEHSGGVKAMSDEQIRNISAVRWLSISLKP